MTRLQKKCFLFSVGMHGLLVVILLGSSAFRDKPVMKDTPILTMIPSKILDQAGAGGGSPEPATAAPQPAQPQAAAPQPVQPVVQPPQQVVQPPQPVAPPIHAAESIEHLKPKEVTKVTKAPEPEPEPLVAKEPAIKPSSKPSKKHPDIVLDYTPAKSSTSKTKTKTTEVSDTAESSSRAERSRLKDVFASLNNLANGVRRSGAEGTVVDMPGQSGGEAFAGYETVIYNVYYHAWITPDSVADKQAGTGVKIVVARDGSIMSSEMINKSGEPVLNRSVERVLRAVTKLPPFPATARDEQRTFLIRFSLDAKEGSG